MYREFSISPLCVHDMMTHKEETMSQHLSDNAPSPQKIGVREFRGNLTAYLRQVRQGSTILVTSHDEVVAELRPPASFYRPRRQPGALRGRIRISEDFDETPPDLLESMERDL
ncbi:prevent-host-death protein [Acetobacter okinawensis]|uniref:type II toxin-antitoxin system Phd/YefM family antitoxin n=1 Tax=Acetobacter okinawensis TaxID=1076594 RepID=UPI001BAB705B|nr:prevent-host-death protein [Acetobacter okinawensis]MBS0989343.1 prevent-host-death protein [Acetobacter okinawensis]